MHREGSAADIRLWVVCGGGWLAGPNTRHKDVDIVVIRENTEGEYSGMEHEVAPGITETIKVTSRAKTRRIAEYAFEYAFLNNRRKVTAVHKANVMVKSDGLFLESCREQARLYPTVELEEVIIDNCMMRVRTRHGSYCLTCHRYPRVLTPTRDLAARCRCTARVPATAL